MSYALDTNVCIALINRDKPAVRARFHGALQRRRIVISTVVLFELETGVAKSTKPEPNRKRLDIFVSGLSETIQFDEEDAAHAARVRARLEQVGTPIGAYDLLIGAQALRRGMTLVTANSREFSRIEGLDLEDWSRP